MRCDDGLRADDLRCSEIAPFPPCQYSRRLCEWVAFMMLCGGPTPCTMDVLPTDVLCVIASHVATQARSVGDVLRLGRLSRRWRVAVEERAIVWRSWGGLEAARRAAAIERAWAAPPPPGVPVDMPISAYHGPLPADDDDDNGGDWAESVRLATNGRFALRLARVGEARVLVLERSGIELATWTLTGDFELAEACIASQGHTVAWISHRAGQASRVLSCAKVGRAAPFNVTVFRTRPMHGRYWKASVSSPNLVAITDGGHFLTRHGYELIRFDELGNNDHSCTLPRCRDVVYLTGTLIAANDDDCGNVMVYDFSACRRVHPHDMSGPQTYNLPKLQVGTVDAIKTTMRLTDFRMANASAGGRSRVHCASGRIRRCWCDYFAYGGWQAGDGSRCAAARIIGSAQMAIAESALCT